MNQKFLDFKNSFNKNLPTINMGLSIGLEVLAVGATVWGTLKIKKIVDENPNADKKTIVKKSIPYAIPTVLFMAASATCGISSDAQHRNREMAFAGAYSFLRDEYRSYKKHAREKLGEKKAAEVEQEVDQDRVNSLNIDTGSMTIPGEGTDLCIDAYSGRPFWTTYDKLEKLEKWINSKLYTDIYVSMNEIWFEVGLEPTKMGGDFGLNTNDPALYPSDYYYDKGDQIPKLVSILPPNTCTTADGHACFVLDIFPAPRYDYIGM